jgi:hypothetical protein
MYVVDVLDVHRFFSFVCSLAGQCQWSERKLLSLVRKWPLLVSLNLSRCTQIGDAFLRALVTTPRASIQVEQLNPTTAATNNSAATPGKPVMNRRGSLSTSGVAYTDLAAAAAQRASEQLTEKLQRRGSVAARRASVSTNANAELARRASMGNMSNAEMAALAAQMHDAPQPPNGRRGSASQQGSGMSTLTESCAFVFTVLLCLHFLPWF